MKKGLIVVLLTCMFVHTCLLGYAETTEWIFTGDAYTDAHLAYAHSSMFETMLNENIAEELIGEISPFIGMLMDAYNFLDQDFENEYVALMIDLMLNQGRIEKVCQEAYDKYWEDTDEILSCITQAAELTLIDDKELNVVLARIDEMKKKTDARTPTDAELNYFDSLLSVMEQAQQQTFVKYMCDELEKAGKWTGRIIKFFEVEEKVSEVIKLSRAYDIYRKMGDCYREIIQDDLQLARKMDEEELAKVLEQFVANNTLTDTTSLEKAIAESTQFWEFIGKIASMYVDEIVGLCSKAAKATGMTVPFITITSKGSGTVMAGAGTVVEGVYLGIEIGTMACDTLLGTQDITAGYKLLKAAQAFERINGQTLKEAAEELQRNPTRLNAERFHEAFELQKAVILYSYDIYEKWMLTLDEQFLKIPGRDYQSVISDIQTVKQMISGRSCCIFEYDLKKLIKKMNSHQDAAVQTAKPMAVLTPTIIPTDTPLLEDKNKAVFRRENIDIDSVFIGEYDVLNDQIDSVVPMEWYIIGYNEKKFTLLSRYVVSERRMNGIPEVDFRKTELYNWLNGEFFSNAFSKSEKEAIEYICLSIGELTSTEKLEPGKRWTGELTSRRRIIEEYPEIMLLEKTEGFHQNKWWLDSVAMEWLPLSTNANGEVVVESIWPTYRQLIEGKQRNDGAGIGYLQGALYKAMTENPQSEKGYSAIKHGYPIIEKLAIRPIIVVDKEYMFDQMGICIPDEHSPDAIIVDDIIEALANPKTTLQDTLRSVFGNLSFTDVDSRINGGLEEVYLMSEKEFYWGNHRILKVSFSAKKYSENSDRKVRQSIMLEIDDSSKKNQYTGSKVFGDTIQYYKTSEHWKYENTRPRPYEELKHGSRMDISLHVNEKDFEKARIYISLMVNCPDYDFDTFFSFMEEKGEEGDTVYIEDRIIPVPTPTQDNILFMTPEPIGEVEKIIEINLSEPGKKTGYAIGAAGNQISVTITVENGYIVTCVVSDENATEEMRNGYDYCEQALIGQSCEHILMMSPKKIAEIIREYVQKRGQTFMSGGYTHKAINSTIQAVKDGLK